jgi:type IV pilus assembly protein PilA
MQKEQAFSLIELLIVIAIIGILSAIAVPSYQKYLMKAKLAEAFTIADKYQNNFAQQYNDGTLGTGAVTSAFSVTNLGGTISTTNVTAVTAGPIASLSCTAGTALVGICVAVNSAITGTGFKIGKVGCINNDIISWSCQTTATDATSIAVVPANCTTGLTNCP